MPKHHTPAAAPLPADSPTAPPPPAGAPVAERIAFWWAEREHPGLAALAYAVAIVGPIVYGHAATRGWLPWQ